MFKLKELLGFTLILYSFICVDGNLMNQINKRNADAFKKNFSSSRPMRYENSFEESTKRGFSHLNKDSIVGANNNFLSDIGEVVLELAHQLRVSEIKICSKINVPLFYIIKFWMEHLLYVLPCNEVSPEPPPTRPVLNCFSAPHLYPEGCIPIRIQVWLVEEFQEETELQMKTNSVSYLQIYHFILTTKEIIFNEQRNPISTFSWLYGLYNLDTREVNLKEVYGFMGSTELVVKSVGFWTSLAESNIKLPLLFGPTNFHNRTIVFTSFVYPPYVMLSSSMTKTSQDGNFIEEQRPSKLVETDLTTDGKLQGFLIDVIEIMAESLNFTYKVMKPPEIHFGVGSADNYTGLVGMLVKKRADIILGSLAISIPRKEVIDFSSVEVERFSRNLFYKSSAIVSVVNWGTYIMGFDWRTWSCCVLLWVIAAVIHWVLRKDKKIENQRPLSNKAMKQQILFKTIKPQDLPDTSLSKFSDIAFTYFGCIVQQGAGSTPDSIRLRVVFWLYFVACVIIYTAYTATLTSFLTVTNERPLFTSFQDVVENSEWKLGLLKGTPLLQTMESIKDPWIEVLSSNIKKDPTLQLASEEKGIEKILTSKFIFFGDGPTMRYLLKGNCSVRELNLDFSPVFGRLGYSKHLPFAGILDYTMSKLRSGGTLDRLRKPYSNENTKCDAASSFKQLGFKQITSAFAVLAIGFAIAMGILSFEIVISRYRSN